MPTRIVPGAQHFPQPIPGHPFKHGTGLWVIADQINGNSDPDPSNKLVFDTFIGAGHVYDLHGLSLKVEASAGINPTPGKIIWEIGANYLGNNSERFDQFYPLHLIEVTGQSQYMLDPSKLPDWSTLLPIFPNDARKPTGFMIYLPNSPQLYSMTAWGHYWPMEEVLWGLRGD